MINSFPSNSTTVESPTSLASTFIESNALKADNRKLQKKLMASQADLQTQQDSIFDLRKKIISLEKEKLSLITNGNEEVTRLSGDVARLRAQVEKGEAVKQNLEYELAKLKRELKVCERKEMEDNKIKFKEVTDELHNKLHELNCSNERLAEELESNRKSSRLELSRLEQLVSEKDKQLSDLVSLRGRLDVDKSELASSLKQKQRYIEELESDKKELRALTNQKEETLQQNLCELLRLKEKDERTQQEFKTAILKIESLEESIKAEHANNLELKYNNEILQNNLKSEKSAKDEALKNMETMNAHMRQLEESCGDEKKNSVKCQDQLRMVEKEMTNKNKHLQAELVEKNSLIASLSDQLNQHQREFDQLKSDLSKTKKKQRQLEEIYTGCLAELQSLIAAYDTSRSCNSKPQNNEKSSAISGKKFTLAVESLRDLLSGYRRKQEQLLSELSSHNLQIDQLTKDCKDYKIKLSNKDGVIQTAADSLEKMKAEAKLSVKKIQNLEESTNKLSKELAAAKSRLLREESVNRELREKSAKMSAKNQSDVQTRLSFMLLLHQQLNTVDGVGGQMGPVLPSMLSNWNDLGLIINEQISALITAHNRSREKAAQLQEAVDHRDRIIDTIQLAHEDQLMKLSTTSEAVARQCYGEKEEREKHYAQLLSEMNERNKKMQSMADESWQKFQDSESRHHRLELECSNVKAQLARSWHNNQSLLSACAILAGALFPMHSRLVNLIKQKDILLRQLVQFDSFKSRILELTSVISVEVGGEREARKRTESFLRFRKAVIAVMAANRLVHFSLDNSRLFVLNNTLPDTGTAIVCVGGKSPEKRRFVGLSRPQYFHQNESPNRSDLSWLTSQDLQSTILSSMADFQLANQMSEEGVSEYNSARVEEVARRCCHKLISDLSSMFDGTCSKNRLRRSILISSLKDGLTKSRSGKKRQLPLASEVLADKLQQNVLEFTQKMHSSEVERKKLRAELTDLQRGRSQKNDEQVERNMTSKLNEVMNQLNLALKREEEAENLLKEQTRQLEELNRRIDGAATEELHKERALTDITKMDLSETKRNLWHQEQTLQDTMDLLTQTEAQKKSLQDKVNDAERALRTAARDKQSLINYCNSVSSLLANLQSLPRSGAMTTDWGQIDSVTELELPSSKPGSDLLVVQNLVAAFVRVQKFFLQQMAICSPRGIQHGKGDERVKSSTTILEDERVNNANTDAIFEDQGDQCQTDVKLLDICEDNSDLDDTSSNPRPRAIPRNKLQSNVPAKPFLPLEEDKSVPSLKKVEKSASSSDKFRPRSQERKSRLPKHQSQRFEKPTTRKYASASDSNVPVRKSSSQP